MPDKSAANRPEGYVAKSTRAYLRTPQKQYRPLFWIQNSKPNELLFGLYGLTETTPTLHCSWPEQTVPSGTPVQLCYAYQDAIDVGIPLDHVTCHADGKFHLKKKKGQEIYFQRMQRVQPLGADTPTFLDVTVVSDLAQHYRVSPPQVSTSVD